MINVPLVDGKTLNVTFRSINTRNDVFNPKKLVANDQPKQANAAQISAPLESTKDQRQLVETVRSGVIMGQQHKRRTRSIQSSSGTIEPNPINI